MDEVPFLRPDREIDRHGSKLPHWQQEDSAVFVTFRLADSIPVRKWEELKRLKSAWLRHHGGRWNEEMQRAWGMKEARRFHRWLDAGHGCCALRSPSMRKPVEQTLRHGDGLDYRLLSAVVMPNHVHALISPEPTKALGSIVAAWKSVSSRRIALIGDWCGWQRNYHDRLIRNGRHLERVVRYVRANPGKLPDGHYWHYEREGLDGEREGLDGGGPPPGRDG